MPGPSTGFSLRRQRPLREAIQDRSGTIFAIAGSDPNWGRIICAAGYSGALFDPDKVDIYINSLLVCREGVDAGFDEAAARKELEQKEVTLRLDLHQGSASAHIWTCDLTHDYITINASYRT